MSPSCGYELCVVLSQAIEFVRGQRDDELWEQLMSWALGSPETTGKVEVSSMRQDLCCFGLKHEQERRVYKCIFCILVTGKKTATASKPTTLALG